MQQQYGVYLPKLTNVNKVLIIAMVFFFILDSILKLSSGVSLNIVMGLSCNGFFNGQIYQLITYPFIGSGLLEVVFNAILLWFIGSEFESSWGTKRYIIFNIFTVVLTGLFFLFIANIFSNSSNAIASIPLTGIVGIVNAQLVAYTVINPDRVFSFFMIFPMRAKYFCWILIGMQLYMGVFSPAGLMVWGHLFAMGLGFIYMKYLFNFNIFSGNFFHKNGKSLYDVRDAYLRELRRKNSQLKIVDNVNGEKEKSNSSNSSSGQHPPKYFQ